jgi:hypothetical protein
MRSRARLIVLSALILLVVAGSVLSWALENNVIESTSTKQVEVSFTEGSCKENGVTIVVEFGDSAEREPILRCATDFIGTGWEVFEATEIEVAGTSQYPVGFACRIENFPPSAEQNCMDTPKYSEGSWGYFVYTEESGWQVSQVGSAARDAQCGSAEGWLFIGPGQQDAVLLPKPIPETVTCDG